jgi:hypothetical protein
MEFHAKTARRKGIDARADEGSGRPRRARRDRNTDKVAVLSRLAQERASCFRPMSRKREADEIEPRRELS